MALSTGTFGKIPCPRLRIYFLSLILLKVSSILSFIDFLLPNNIKEGDYIELGQLGAYGLTFRTEFNGFYSNEICEVEDSPIMTMYEKENNSEFLVA